MPAFAPPLALVERFRTDFERLAGGAPARLGVAVSGGPDSLALLLLACAAYDGRVEAATVDHGLRPEAKSEAAFVAGLCEQMGCPHETIAVQVEPGGQGVQGEARRARYAALRAWAAKRDIAILCTAHHADDQAETLLMRLQRGSGIAGLSGIRAVRKEGPSLTLARPLLGWTQAELGTLVEASGLQPIDDPSNRDSRFDRVAMRQFLRDNPKFEPFRLARSASALAEAEEALAWSMEEIGTDRCSFSGGEYHIDHVGLPREYKRRLLSGAIADVRRNHGIEPAWTGSEDVEGLLCTLENGGTATLAGAIASGGGKVWRIRLAPPRNLRDSA